MRFKRCDRRCDYDFTDRKQKAFARKQRQECERSPLLAEQIHEDQHSVEQELAKRLALFAQSEKRMRDLRARHWRQVRALYFGLSSAEKQIIRNKWVAWTGPAESQHLSYLIRQLTGEYERICEEQRRTTMLIRDRLKGGEQLPLL